MTKLIDLSHRKEATDLLVDSALIAIWYGFPEAARLLLRWMKHRTDESASTMWTDALRSMRFDQFDEAEATLRSLLDRDPTDSHAVALLVCVLDASGQPGASAAVATQLGDAAIAPTAQALIDSVRTQRAVTGNARQNTLAQGVVMG